MLHIVIRPVVSCLLFLAPGLLLIAEEPATNSFQKLRIEYTGGEYKSETFNYRLLSPPEIEAGKTYPLILFLHGAGERGDDNEAQLKYLPSELAKPAMRAKYPCFVLAPQCRKDKRWVDTPWADKVPQPMTDHPTDMMQVAIATLRRTVKEQPIDTSRRYLAGLSMGGFGSWDLSARHPRLFAAAIIVCGGGDPDQASKLTRLPIWAFHGDADTVVPVERSRIMVEAIKDNGGDLINYTELPGVGHNSWTHAFDDSTGALQWMFDHSLPTPPPHL